jgi:hypothetical protein
MEAIMKRVMIVVGLGLIASTIGGASLSLAKTETCRPEMEKFCNDVAPGEGRVLKCLQQHDAELSQACRAYVNTASQYVACLDDLLRLRPHPQPRGARGMKCLRTHQGELSTECKNQLRKR